MKYRVWIVDIGEWTGTEPIEAPSSAEAAGEFVDNVDAVGGIFPDETHGDVCTIGVCKWEDLDESGDEPEHETLTFKLVIDRRVERQR